MDIPTSETVLMESMFEDPIAEGWITYYGIIDRMVKHWAGKPITIPQRELLNLKGDEWISPPTADVMNRVMHQYGWHLEVWLSNTESYEYKGNSYRESCIKLSKWYPEKGFWNRIKRAWRVLVGKEES